MGKASRQESIATRSGSTEEGVLYSDDEVLFLKAVDQFKQRAKVRFPTAVDLYRLAKRHLEANVGLSAADEVKDVRAG